MTERPSVHELLVAVKHGDIKAAGQLYGLHLGSLSKTLMEQGFSVEETKDIIQDTFEKILSNIDKYDESRRGGSTWIRQICRNVATDSRRRQKSYILSLEQEMNRENEEGQDQIVGEPRDHDEMVDPEKYVGLRELTRAIEEAAEHLSEADREALRQPKGKRGPASGARKQALRRLKALTVIDGLDERCT